MQCDIPSYRLHKPSGLAMVRLSGRHVYLGRYGTPESRAEYDRQIAAWLARGRTPPGQPVTVSRLVAACLEWASPYYRRRDRRQETCTLELASRPLVAVCGHLEVNQITPVDLLLVRDKMIAAGLCRREINRRISCVRRIYRWGVERGIVDAATLHRLQAVSGLRQGRSGARERHPVDPVPLAAVTALEGVLPPLVRRMVWVQLLTGMRPGEVCGMRAGEIDRSGESWVYRPASHKGSHAGRGRAIAIGPQARSVLVPIMPADPAAPVFPGRRRGEGYTVVSYRQAIVRACDRAGVPRWHPHQLRHLAASRIRAAYGLDVARAVLGHRAPSTTAIYAEIDATTCARVALEMG